MLLYAFVVWPLDVLVRKANPFMTWWAMTVRLWLALVGGMLGLFVFRAVGVLYVVDSIGGMPNFVWGVSDEMIDALNSIYLPVLLALPLPILPGWPGVTAGGTS